MQEVSYGELTVFVLSVFLSVFVVCLSVRLTVCCCLSLCVACEFAVSVSWFVWCDVLCLQCVVVCCRVQVGWCVWVCVVV